MIPGYWLLTTGMCDEKTPWEFSMGEVLKNFTIDCDAKQLRQQIEIVRDDQVTKTNELSKELARLNEQEGFVEKLIGGRPDSRGRPPELL